METASTLEQLEQTFAEMAQAENHEDWALLIDLQSRAQTLLTSLRDRGLPDSLLKKPLQRFLDYNQALSRKATARRNDISVLLDALDGSSKKVI